MPRHSSAIGPSIIKEVRRRLRANYLPNHFGFRLIEAQAGRVLLRMRVEKRHKQSHGVVHGGVLAALVDTAGGIATSLSYPAGTRVATIELKVNYLEAVPGGFIIADAEVVRKGNHIAVVDCDVRDQNHRLVVKALMSFFVGPFPDEDDLHLRGGRD